MATEKKSSAKEETIVVDTRKRVSMIVTEKGASMKSNKWKKGETITVGALLSEKFEKDGIATYSK
jgi:hypothetical protein